MLAVALAAGLVLAGTAGSAAGDVYKLTVTATSAALTEQWVEWIATDSGRWRMEESARTYLYTGTSYAILDRRNGAYVRTGSPVFLGSLPERAVSRNPLRGYLAGNLAGMDIAELPDGRKQLTFRRGELKIVATIEERLSAAEAQQRKLFVVPADEVTSSNTERRPGARPTLPVRAYWFGPRFAGRVAVTAVEHFAGPAAARGGARTSQPRTTIFSHVTFYELPSARGKASAFPGQRAPPGEIQVLSQPLASATAQRAIRVYNGFNGDLRSRPWPRTSVTLRSGERVTVIPDRSESTGKTRNGFAVVTKTTLVNVTGRFRLNSIPATARLLQPIG